MGSRLAQGFKPSVIFRDAKGNVQFPGRSADQPPKGYTRVELRSSREVFRFEREMDMRCKREHDRSAEAEARRAAEVRGKLRGELRSMMQHMTPYGRDFARAAMDRNDRAPTKSYDPGFHLPVFHFNSSNIPPHRSEDTDWKERRA